MKLQKLAACTGLPLTEEEPEKSANLCFSLQPLSKAYPAYCISCAMSGKKLQEVALPLPLDFDADADAPSASAGLLQKRSPPLTALPYSFEFHTLVCNPQWYADLYCSDDWGWK